MRMKPMKLATSNITTILSTSRDFSTRSVSASPIDFNRSSAHLALVLGCRNACHIEGQDLVPAPKLMLSSAWVSQIPRGSPDVIFIGRTC